MTGTTGDLSRKLGNLSVENSEKSEKCEEFEKWNELPVDLQLECIEKMNFAMRYQLRLTARTENQLVDSLRYKFDLLSLERHSFSLHKNITHERYDTRERFFDTYHSYRGHVDNRDRSPNMKTVKMLPYVLKHCDFEKFDFRSCKLLDRIDFDKLGTVLKPKSVSFVYYMNHGCTSSSLKMLKKCWNKVPDIFFSAPEEPVRFEEFFAIPTVFNAKNVYVSNWQLSQTIARVIPLIEKWIEIDARVGTKFSITSATPPIKLFDHFQNRSISRDESTMRIRTDNPQNHILMHFSTVRFPYFWATVVPSVVRKWQYPNTLKK